MHYSTSQHFMQIIAGQGTHKGLVREANEDVCAWFSTAKGELFLLADGMGGQSCGEEAAQLAISTVHEYIDKHDEASIESLIIKAILTADTAITKAFYKASPVQMSLTGCTLVFLLLQEQRAYYVHVGDSRLYILRDGSLQQLTRDHSHVQDLIDKGEITRGEAAVHPLCNVITQHLGGEVDIAKIAVKQYQCKQDDKFLLCSDGLWGMVAPIVIENTLKLPCQPQEQVDMLINSALSAGGEDNIAVQIAAYGINSK